jgi:hypothetical protein
MSSRLRVTARVPGVGDLLVPIASTATVRELQEAVARCGPRGFAGASLLRLFSFFCLFVWSFLVATFPPSYRPRVQSCHEESGRHGLVRHRNHL